MVLSKSRPAQGAHVRPIRAFFRPRPHGAGHRRSDRHRPDLRRGAAQRRRAGDDRLAQGGGLRGGGARAFFARAMRGLRRHGRDRGRRCVAGRGNAEAHRRFAHSHQQRRPDLGRAVRDLSLEGLGTTNERQCRWPVLADPRSRADADRVSRRRKAVDGHQRRFGDGLFHAVGKRLRLFRLEGRRASPDAYSRPGARRAAGDGQRYRPRAVSDQHDPFCARR